MRGLGLALLCGEHRFSFWRLRWTSSFFRAILRLASLSRAPFPTPTSCAGEPLGALAGRFPLPVLLCLAFLGRLGLTLGYFVVLQNEMISIGRKFTSGGFPTP